MNQDQMTDENLKNLQATGGAVELARKLGVDHKVGLTSEEAASGFVARGHTYGVNAYPEPPMKGFWVLWVESFNDLTLIVLIVAAIVSLIVGGIEDPAKGWIDGVAILIAVLLVAFVTAGNDYSKELQFRALNSVKDSIDIKVLRDGKQAMVNTKDIQVGDIIILETGDKIPADCVYLRGDDVESNESSLTGEPEDIKKNADKDPFLLSGCQITAGACRAIVLAVGEHSRWGRIKSRLATEPEDTPLQEKLDDMAKFIGYVGGAAGLSTMAVMIIMWYADPASRPANTTITKWVIHAFIVFVTIIVVAVPEGLPLAVTISLAYSTKKMLSDNNLIRVLAACETMGNATNICSDKTGTLTKNQMTVVAGWLGGRKFTLADGIPPVEELPGELKDWLMEGMCVNSSAELRQTDDGRREVIGSKTEGALLMMTEGWGADYFKVRAATVYKKQYMFSSARKMMSALVARPDGSYRLYVKGASEIVMGRSTSVLQREGDVVDMTDAHREELKNQILEMARGALRTIGIAHRDFKADELPADWDHTPPENDLVFEGVVGIQDPLRDDVVAAVRTCQKAGIMVRMVTGDNLETAKAIARQCGILTEGGEAIEGPTFREMTPEQLDAVLPRLQVLARSSPDDKHTLVVRLNGIKLPKDEKAWREMHPGSDYDANKDRILPGYREEWIAKRGGNTDGEVVGVTGDGTNDAPALKAADVGLSMGLSGTEVAKEASDIVIMDDRFSSIVKAVLWGRSVYDNIRKFLQFQLTVNVVALATTFLAAVLKYDPPLNPVMMLWVNLIMDTMGALALGTEPPTMDLLNRRPYRRTASLVNKTMWRNILVQSAYQLAMLLTILLAGGTVTTDDGGTPDDKSDDTISVGLLGEGVLDGLKKPCAAHPTNPDASRFGADGTTCAYGHDNTHFTVMFNAFVWAQIFNEFNARRINNDWRVFKGLMRNTLFLGVIVISAGMQAFMVEVGGDFTKTTPLNGTMWGLSILLGFVALPLGVVMRFVPVTDNQADFGGYPDPLANTAEGRQMDLAVLSQSQRIVEVEEKETKAVAPGAAGSGST